MKNIFILLYCMGVLDLFAANPQMLARTEIRKSVGLGSLSIFYDSYPIISRDHKLYVNMHYLEEAYFGLHQFDLVSGQNQSLFQIDGNFRISEPVFPNPSHALVSVYDDRKTYGILSIDTRKASYKEVYKVAEDQTLQLNSLFLRKKNLYFRFHNRSEGGQGLAYVDSEQSLKPLSNLKTTPVSYSFSPCSNTVGSFAFKERVSTDGDLSENRGDQLVYVPFAYAKRTVLKDKDLDPKSKIKKIYNHCHMNDQGEIYQVVEYDKGIHALLKFSNGKWYELAKDGQGDVGEIQYFAASSNDLGEYAFRAKDLDGQESIFLFDRYSRLILKIKKGDRVQTENGIAIISHIQKKAPSFAGRPALSNYGLAFTAFLVEPKTSKSLGHALYYYHLREIPNGASF